MKEKLHKALSTFVEAMRLYEVAFIMSHYPSEKWYDILFSKLKPGQQMAWNNRRQMLDDSADLKCLIDFDNMKSFALGFKDDLFNGGISRGDISKMATWIDDLHEIRNKESHHNPIDDDEITSAFVNMKRVARLLGMGELVTELDNIKARPMAATVAVQQQQADSTPSAPVINDNEDESNIISWFNNVIPHYDIRTGALDESVFAANLAEVAQGTGKEVYIDRTMFFEKTYITGGLKDLANRVIQALNGEETENRVISLQTGFGGGKTHSLISLYHIAKAGKDIETSAVAQSLLKENVHPQFENAHVAAFTDNTTDVVQGHVTSEGLTIRTIWGELAYQLGGVSAYEIVRENDEAMIAPSQGIFMNVLNMCSPSLILVDELAAYCVKAAARRVGNSDLSDQTINFMQTLTQAVSDTPKSVLIMTLPASKNEVGADQKSQEILTALQNRVIRVGTNVQPVQDMEIFEVIRRRLFESICNPETVKRIVEKYCKYYNKRRTELPSFVNNGTYRELMRKSYPFHPELINIFRDKWGQDSRFQRTRGVLRLLAAIVNDLWKRRHSLVGTQGLVHTSDVNLQNVQSLAGTITNLKGTQWDSVLSADITGASSNSSRIDNEDPQSDLCRYQIAQGVGTTVMLASVAGKNNSNISIEELKLCMIRPGAFKPAEIENALSKLEGRAHYMYSSRIDGRRYWFESRPNINILLTQAKNQISSSAIDREITDRLNSLVGTNMEIKALVDPTADVPEQKSLTLVVLGPEYQSNGVLHAKTKARIEQIATQRGSSPRVYRNTILFLVITEQGYNILADKLRNYLACKKILDEYRTLDKDQKDDVISRRKTADSETNQAIINAYTQVVKFTAQNGCETLPHFSVTATNFNDYLRFNVLQALKEEEWIIRRIGLGTLHEVNLYPTVEEPVQISKLYEAFLRYDDKPMITGPEAIVDSVQKFCGEGTFNVGHGEKCNYTAIDVRSSVPFLSADDQNAWLLDPSVKLEETGSGSISGNCSTSSSSTSSPGTNSSSSNSSNYGASSSASTSSSQPKKYKRVSIQGNVPMEHWTDLFGSFVNILRNNGLKIEVKFDAKSTPLSELSENSQLFKSIKESASQLGLDIITEEEEE